MRKHSPGRVGRIRRTGAAAVLSAGVLVLGMPSVGTASQASGTPVTFSANPGYYRDYSTVVTYARSVAGYVYVESSPFKNLPAGWLGLYPRLYASNGALKTYGPWTYSPANTAGMSASTFYNTTPGTSFYSHGMTQGWNGSKYVSHTTSRSPNQTV